MRNEYPRPDFVREDWMNLNGPWDFYVGDKKYTIQVPYVCQSEMSGIGERITEDCVVYERSFTVPERWKEKRIFLNFGAVDYRCRVWINGTMAGCHTGGQTSFRFDVTDLLGWETETIRVEAEDPLRDEKIARGKQFWGDQPQFIWYTPSTGIWQTVWLEPVEETRLEWLHFTPDIDAGTVRMDLALAKSSALPCEAEITIWKGAEEVFHVVTTVYDYESSVTAEVFGKKALNGAFHFTGAYWSPENPLLYDVSAGISAENRTTDRVRSYFGMRKIEAINGKIYLNHKPYYQKLLLDQGYWKESLITAPSDEAYREDILKAKAMGFNGCRKHEKVEDPRFLYWADKLGFLVWESMASFWVYTPQAASAFMREWMDTIQRDYNHPSIVVWGMLNESWGVPEIRDSRMQQSFAKALYYLAHSLDCTRLVVSNDGWEMTDTDIFAVHSYQHGEKDNRRKKDKFEHALQSVGEIGDIVEKSLCAGDTAYQNQPVMLTEFGGISVSCRENGWGYTAVEKDGFLDEFGRIIEAIRRSDLICGYCYTQLADIEQEVNGLLTEEHEFKFDPEAIRKIVSAD
ncbi:MAG: glycoside hydrolase family 2 [Clostridiales bacterium]|nr:glycoside hydrolase family 2 [Clostridiales bacterium]